MEATAVLSEVAALVNECQALREENERLKRSSFNADKFYNVILSTKDVARLHAVSDYLVRKYIGRGLIATHPLSTDDKILIRASDALVLDFKNLKEKSKWMK